MVDIIDRINERDEFQETLAKPDHFTGTSSTHCKLCGEKIPEKRRSVGNRHTCTPCEAIQEAKSKHMRR